MGFRFGFEVCVCVFRSVVGSGLWVKIVGLCFCWLFKKFHTCGNGGGGGVDSMSDCGLKKGEREKE